MSLRKPGLKSQIFRKLFSSYIVIISLFYLLYSTLAIYECYVMNKERTQRENQIKIQEATNVLDQRLMTAQNLVSRINTSTTIKKLYTHVLDNSKPLDAYTLFSIVNDMGQISTSTGRLDVDEVVIFVDDYDKCYTGTGVVHLVTPYVHSQKVLPAVEVNTIQSALNVDGNGRLTFQRNNVLYMDNYTYSNGSRKGVISVSFDMTAIERDLEDILGKESGYQLLWGDNVILDQMLAQNTGEAYEKTSRVSSNFCLRIQIPRINTWSTAMTILVFFLLVGLAVTVLFILLAYYFTKRYYEPIDNMEHMMGVNGQESSDETERLLSGLQNLIGERNGYREKMVTITPYARMGMLHGMLTGNMEHDAVKVLNEENYMDLKKPFFIVSVVNFAYKDVDVEQEIHKEKIFEVFSKVVSIFSTDETKLSYYKKDVFHVFLVVNSDLDQPLDELFYQIHKFVIEYMDDENCLITFGIDEIRDNINELGEACEGAMKALEGMVLSGRGEVYFFEQKIDKSRLNYYFPKNAVVKMVKLLKDNNLDEVKLFLSEIYNKNLERSRTISITADYLVDELHVMTLKSIKELSELNTTHINVNKIKAVATLEEIFDYYAAVYEAVIRALKEAEHHTDEDRKLDSIILDYIKENYTNAELSLQYLTDKFGISNKYISLLCKNELGVTYLQYVHEKRIGHAVELLETTDDTLEKISELSGYTSQLTFRRNFKMVTGMNPSDYRNQ